MLNSPNKSEHKKPSILISKQNHNLIYNLKIATVLNRKLSGYFVFSTIHEDYWKSLAQNYPG